MSDAQKNLSILITTPADTSGLTQTNQGLKQVAASAKSAESDLEASLAGIAAANRKAAGSQEEAGQAAEKSQESHRGLNKIFAVLGKQTVPELGHALHALEFGPLIGGFLAVAFAGEFAFEKLKKKAEEAAAQIEAVWEIQAAAAERAQQSIDDLETALRSASEPADKIKTIFENSNSVLLAMVEEHKKILKALEDEETAAAQGDDEALKRIHARYEAARGEYDMHVAMRKLDEQRREIEERKEAQTGTASTVTDESDAMSGTRGKSSTGNKLGLADIAEQAVQSVKDLENNPEYKAAVKALATEKGGEKAAIAAQMTIDNLGGEEHVRNMKPSTPQYDEAGRDSANIIYEAGQEALRTKAAFEGNTMIVNAHTESVRVLTDAQNKAKQAAVENETAITQQTEKLKTDESVLKQHFAGDEIQKAIEISQRAGKGQAPTGAEETFIKSLGTLISGQSVNTQQAEQMFMVAARNQSALETFLAKLFAALDKMPDFRGYELRIQTLESKFSNLNSRANFGALSPQ